MVLLKTSFGVLKTFSGVANPYLQVPVPHLGVILLNLWLLSTYSWVLKAHLGVQKVYLGVLVVHLGVSKVHLGVSIGVILTHFKGFWVLRRKLSSLKGKFSGFLKTAKRGGFWAFILVPKVLFGNAIASETPFRNHFFSPLSFQERSWGWVPQITISSQQKRL